MNDKEFLIWLYNRLYYVYHENQNVDYMRKLASIINATDENKFTPNVGGYYIGECNANNYTI